MTFVYSSTGVRVYVQASSVFFFMYTSSQEVQRFEECESVVRKLVKSAS